MDEHTGQNQIIRRITTKERKRFREEHENNTITGTKITQPAEGKRYAFDSSETLVSSV